MKTHRIAAACAAILALPAFADHGTYGFVDLHAVDHDRRVLDTELAFGGRIGVGFPVGTLGGDLEVGIFGNRIKLDGGPTGSQRGLMLDYVQTFSTAGVRPFLFIGVGLVQEEFGVVEGNYGAAEAGIGLRFGAPGNVNYRTALSAQNVNNDDLDPQEDSYLDTRFSLGLMVPIGEAPRAPVDSDRDGVVDSRDRCPTTAAPTPDGCPAPVKAAEAPRAAPRDSDRDGVDDASDRCPGTLQGLKVDDEGCAVATTTQSIVLKGVNFLPSSTELTPDAKKVLDQAAQSLAGQEGLRVELGGHTDSMGDDALNLSLSQRRAEAVRQYLVGKGIAGNRLTAKGYGETQPIADNKTAAGRKSNRRVELKIVR